MFQTDFNQSLLPVYKVNNAVKINNAAPSKGYFQTLQRKYHWFGLFDQFQDSTKFGSIKHYFSQHLSFHYFILNTPYLIIRSIFLVFAIYRSNVNTSLKNEVFFENIYFPSKLIMLDPECLKELTDNIPLRSDEKEIFY